MRGEKRRYCLGNKAVGLWAKAPIIWRPGTDGQKKMQDLHTAIWNLVYTNSENPTTWNAYEDYQGTTSAWAISNYEVESFDSEENIWIDKRWHQILVYWLKSWFYDNMWVNFQSAATNERANYETQKNNAIQDIVDRWQLADTAYFPDLNFLNY